MEALNRERNTVITSKACVTLWYDTFLYNFVMSCKKARMVASAAVGQGLFYRMSTIKYCSGSR
jgi:hypothetical protein